MTNETVRPFSAGYFMLDADILQHSGERVIIPRDYFGELSQFAKYPLLRVSTQHYWAYPEAGVPGRTVVVPDTAPDIEDGDPVLMAKDETTQRLIVSGEKDKPNP